MPAQLRRDFKSVLTLQQKLKYSQLPAAEKATPRCDLAERAGLVRRGSLGYQAVRQRNEESPLIPAELSSSKVNQGAGHTAFEEISAPGDGEINSR